MKRTRAGPKGKLTPEIQKAIVDAVALGLKPHLVAAQLGIGTPTMDEWIRRGEHRDARSPAPEYVEFVKALRGAQVQAIAPMLRAVRHAALKTKLKRVRGKDEPVMVYDGDPRLALDFIKLFPQHLDMDGSVLLDGNGNPKGTAPSLGSVKLEIVYPSDVPKPDDDRAGASEEGADCTESPASDLSSGDEAG